MIIKVGEIEIKLIRKKARRITLKVGCDGAVSVSAPKNASVDYVENFVRQNKDWIIRMLEKKKDGPFLALSCNDGDKMTVFGNTYLIKLVIDGQNNVEICGDSLVVHVVKHGLQNRQTTLKNWIKDMLDKEVRKLIDKWKEKTGLSCSAVVFKDTKSRWGSCNVVSKKLSFSLRLVTQKRECIDYVVLHELAHTIYKNHDKNFYDFVANYMSDYKRVSKQLKTPIVT